MSYLNFISTIVSAIGMIFITYYVYKMAKVNDQKDKYLRYIYELYYQIENDTTIISKLSSNKEAEAEEHNQSLLCRHVKINSVMMLYYVNRFPGYNSARTELWKILIQLIAYPSDVELYDSFSIAFTSFCLRIKKNKFESQCFTIDPKKDGYANESF